jgi:hypothetical protein
VSEKYAQLRCARPGQHVHKREAFDKLLFFDPLAFFLDLRLHDSHDGRAAIAHGTDFQKNPCDLRQTDASLAHVIPPIWVALMMLAWRRWEIEA